MSRKIAISYNLRYYRNQEEDYIVLVRSSLLPAVICLVFASLLFAQEEAVWRPVPGRIQNRWASEVTPETAWREYPRPTLVRESWLNLNGLWDYAVLPKDTEKPDSFDGKILVPFPIESSLSGVGKAVGPDNRLWYRRLFSVPEEWSGKSILLHFGAVDWEAEVRVNGRLVGVHQGGYDPFGFDITDFLNDTGQQELVLGVWDPVDAGRQPRGKQVMEPRSIWYTSVTGIWQTVWIEPIDEVHIRTLRIGVNVAAQKINLQLYINGGSDDCTLKAVVYDGESPIASAEVAAAPSVSLDMLIPDPKLWSPDSPFLYGLRLSIEDTGGKIVDKAESYFGMRKIALGKDKNGYTRILLNDSFLFQFGPLDQGWWPDGLYTAPGDEALRYDLEVTKQLGMNMLRKHVKVEPERFYYWCDKLGLLVWQDMPSGDAYIGPDGADIERSAQSARQFELELGRIIGSLYNHPSIIMWVPFNEGWGQYDTERIAALIKEFDPTRLVNNASGWADRGAGEVIDVHSYPGPAAPDNERGRASVLGEFGGLGLPLAGHTWQEEKNWGYRSYTTQEQLTEAYIGLVEKLPYLIARGLSAAVYTQTTDVEIEVNGLMTYDRALIKMDAERIAPVNLSLYQPPPEIVTVVPTAKEQPVVWKYTLSEPPGGWQAEDFDDSFWESGYSGFGTSETPGTSVTTLWDTSDIWLRCEFELADLKFQNLHLLIHHDEGAEVYVNGVLALEAAGYTSAYLPEPISAESRAALRHGRNLLAVHCRQTRGGQYIDAGFVDIRAVGR
jgi:hypothetical protein